MIKTYIEFFYPGSFVANTTTQEVPSRTARVAIPDGAFGYRFFDRNEIACDGELLVGQSKNFSGMTYLGETMTAAEVEANVPDCSILLSNMRCNNWDRVVRTRRGNFQPLNENDTVIAV